MSDLFASMLARTRRWFELAADARWLDEPAARRLADVETARPGDLFTTHDARPLVVALFGGTGVGKSSLLNRLAGANLARIGVERPTSREVTLYVHDAAALAPLPPAFSAERVQVARHARREWRDIAWLDTPDIDSTEPANRELALACLPHVDLLVYIVSPERYRDDVGWRVLRDRGHRHGWIFAVNRWDEGNDAQIEDFAAMLRGGGFEQPLIFRTCCVEAAARAADEFDELHRTIQTIHAEHGLAELERLGLSARLAELRDALTAAQRRLGDQSFWSAVTTEAAEQWTRAEAVLRSAFEPSIAAAAARVGRNAPAASLASVVRSLKAGVSEASPSPAPLASEMDVSLWDDWSRWRVGEVVDSVELAARRAAVAVEPIRTRLERACDDAGARVDAIAQEHLRLALAVPGTRLQRAARRATGFLTVVAPGLAMLYVAWQIVEGYIRATQGRAEFVDSRFALHSTLFVAVCWLIPYLCDRALRPSLALAAAGGLRRGISRGLAELGQKLLAALDEAARDAGGLRSQADRLLLDLQQPQQQAPRPDAAVRRAIPSVHDPTAVTRT